MPTCDTPCITPGLSRGAAEAAWRAVTASIAGTPHVRVSRDGGRTFPARHARPLPADPPGQPCTVPVYDPGPATGRMLALDLDPARARVDQGVDTTLVSAQAEVERQAAEVGQLLERLGGRCITDVSPPGGRHVFVVFASPLPWRELRDVALALALRYPSIDPAPMSSLGGQISPPGSRHKSGGWRLLSMPLEDARAAVEHPNGPEVWNNLLTELAAELREAESVNHVDNLVNAEFDDTGVPWVPRLGSRAPLGAELEQIARTGRWNGSRYPGRSEARMAVLVGAAGRGWRLAEVRAAVDSGAWKGLAGLYRRTSEPRRLDRLLPLEWRKCVGRISREENVRRWHTSDLSSRPPPQANRPSQRSTDISASGLRRSSARPRTRSGSRAGEAALSLSAWCCSPSVRRRW